MPVDGRRLAPAPDDAGTRAGLPFVSLYVDAHNLGMTPRSPRRRLGIGRLAPLLLAVCALATSAAEPAAPPAPAASQALLIRHANVVDVRDGHVAPDRAILIEGDRITAIGDDAAALKRQAKGPVDEVDAHGHYAIPGLWDMHMHIEGQDLVEDNRALMPVYVAYGITTVRDCASDLGALVLQWRDDVKAGRMFGPRIYTAGRKLEGLHTIWKGALEIDNERDLAHALDLLEGWKVDFVKITENTLRGPLFLESVVEARQRGFKVSGHVPLDLSIANLANAGFSSIEHATHVIRLGSDERATVAALQAGTLTKPEANRQYYRNFDQARAVEGYKMLAAHQVAVTPTLIGGKQLAFIDEDDHSKDAYLQYLTQRFTANYAWRLDRQRADTPAQVQQRKADFRLVQKQLPYLQAAGVTLLAGTDAAALNSFIYPGLSLHQELRLFQESGLTPLATLQAATINGARFMGVSDVLGTVEPGKIADLVLLNRNPLVDISATRDIDAVVRGGAYLDRHALDALLDAARQKKVALDAARASETKR
jgi:imidazolonepropionase-like amidohydrolase